MKKKICEIRVHGVNEDTLLYGIWDDETKSIKADITFKDKKAGEHYLEIISEIPGYEECLLKLNNPSSDELFSWLLKRLRKFEIEKISKITDEQIPNDLVDGYELDIDKNIWVGFKKAFCTENRSYPMSLINKFLKKQAKYKTFSDDLIDKLALIYLCEVKKNRFIVEMEDNLVHITSFDDRGRKITTVSNIAIHKNVVDEIIRVLSDYSEHNYGEIKDVLRIFYEDNTELTLKKKVTAYLNYLIYDRNLFIKRNVGGGKLRLLENNLIYEQKEKEVIKPKFQKKCL